MIPAHAIEKLVRLNFEIWSVYQYFYYRTASNNKFYDEIFLGNYWNGHRGEFKILQKYADRYWDFKNLIRVAKDINDLKPVLDYLKQINSGLTKDFLDVLYNCSSDLYRMKYSSMSEAIQDCLDVFDGDPDPDPDPEPEEPIEELEVRVLKTIYALSGAINHGILNNYAHSLGNTGSVVIVKPYSQLSLTPGDIQPPPYIQPARMYAGTMNRLEVIMEQGEQE